MEGSWRAPWRHKRYPNYDGSQMGREGRYWPRARTTAVRHSAAIRQSADMRTGIANTRRYSKRER
jgi:hypothetical protein